MKKVLVLGAGLVTRPLVRYLLDHGFQVTVASRTVSKAEKLIDGHSHGKAVALDVDDEACLRDLIAAHDLAVSLLPYVYHVKVAGLCIELGKHMVTTSYVSDAMRGQDQAAQSAGILILNEIGVDPGIDHMSAMRVIHRVKGKGGHIESFRSYCGGLPAPEANDNPLGYKFSWSPRGVVLAGRNNARYLENGNVIEIPGQDLFLHHHPIRIADMDLEFYPNRDSMGYIDLYGLDRATTMFRGTLRNPGWCRLWKKIADLNLLDLTERDIEATTWAEFIAGLIGNPPGDLRQAMATHLGVSADDRMLEQMEWLGFFSREPLNFKHASNLDVLAGRLLEKMQYAPGERDLLVLHHDFIAHYPETGRREHITSTMVDYGIPGGDTSMARTVSLPAAIAVRLILEGDIVATGVHIPVTPSIYEPVLDELEVMKISCNEVTEDMKPAQV